MGLLEALDRMDFVHSREGVAQGLAWFLLPVYEEPLERREVLNSYNH